MDLRLTKRVSFLLILIIGIFPANSGLGAPIGSDLKPELDRALDVFVKLEYFSGIVLVAREGKILYSRAVGEANKDHHVLNTLDTKFELASLSKLFTGIGFMQLVEKGEIDLNDPVKKHLPEFPFPENILIIHLLTHTSGIPDYSKHPEYATFRFQFRIIDHIIPFIYEQKLKHETPGKVFAYSSSAFVLLGHIIEKKTGLRFPDYIRKNVLESAGMTETTIANLENVVESRATGYIKNSIGKFRTNSYYLPAYIASAGIQSTVEDMLKFDSALNRGILLKPDTLEKMYEPFIQDNWGVVWRLDEVNGEKVAYHGGETEGVSAMFRRYLDSKTTLVVLSNYHRAGRPLTKVFEAILFGKDYEMPKATFTEFLYQRMEKNGVDATIKDFDRLSEDYGHKVKSKDELIELGVDLLRDRQYDTAIAVFKLNTRLFPKDADVYDYLGYACQRKGDRESAIKYYEKALEINPNMATAKESLKELKRIK